MAANIIGEGNLEVNTVENTIKQSSSFAEVIRRWKCFARNLNISEAQILVIETNINLNPDSLHDVVGEILRKWKASQGSAATLEILQQALDKAGCNDVAQSLQNLNSGGESVRQTSGTSPRCNTLRESYTNKLSVAKQYGLEKEVDPAPQTPTPCNSYPTSAQNIEFSNNNSIESKATEYDSLIYNYQPGHASNTNRQNGSARDNLPKEKAVEGKCSNHTMLEIEATGNRTVDAPEPISVRKRIPHDDHNTPRKNSWNRFKRPLCVTIALLAVFMVVVILISWRSRHGYFLTQPIKQTRATRPTTESWTVNLSLAGSNTTFKPDVTKEAKNNGDRASSTETSVFSLTPGQTSKHNTESLHQKKCQKLSTRNYEDSRNFLKSFSSKECVSLAIHLSNSSDWPIGATLSNASNIREVVLSGVFNLEQVSSILSYSNANSVELDNEFNLLCQCCGMSSMPCH